MAIDEQVLARAVAVLRRAGLRASAANARREASYALEDSDILAEIENEFDEYRDEALRRLATAGPGARREEASPHEGRSPSRLKKRPVPPDLKISAPFRFVVIPDTVVMATEMASLSVPLAKGYCATIDVCWVAETPLLIGEEKGGGVVEPMTLAGPDDFVIPGATLRGLIRSELEIIAHGKLGPANLHHRFGIRDFEHIYYRDKSGVSDVKKVKAAWLHREAAAEPGTDPTYYLTPLDNPGNNGWAQIQIDDLIANRLTGRYGSRSEWIGARLADKYSTVGMKPGKIYDFTRKRGFANPLPEKNGGYGTKLGGARDGILVFADKLPGKGGNKKVEYVFFDDPNAQAIKVKDDVWNTFVRLYSKPSKNKPVPDGSWKELFPTVEAGSRIPVFYVGDLGEQGAGFAFGLTRLFKVPHLWTVENLLARQPGHAAERDRTKDGPVAYRPDFVENLFGYVDEPRKPDEGATGDALNDDGAALKGRVAFGFAHLDGNQKVKRSRAVETIMMAPRASFAPFYVRGRLKDWSDDEARLAGRKRYLPRYPGGAIDKALADIDETGKLQIARVSKASGRRNPEVETRLVFLLPADGKEMRFRSTIRLHNVSAAELGAVLFALTHGGDRDKPCRHMIGRAKPFGAGQLRVDSARLSAAANAKGEVAIVPPDQDEIVSTDGKGFCPSPADTPEANASHKPFLEAFKTWMRDNGVPNFPNVAVVDEFLGACQPENGHELAESKTLSYLELGDFNAIRKLTKPWFEHEPPVLLKGADDRLLPAPRKRR